MSLTDAQKFWLDLRNAGTKGIHSWEPRYSKNISQRAKDVTTKGEQVWKRTERRNGRPGTRYWLDGFQPHDAVPVRPNNTSETGTVDGNGPSRDSSVVEHRPETSDVAGSTPAPGAVQPLNITPAPEQVAIREPVAIVRDFTDPEGCWREVPVSELDFDYEAAA